MSSSRPAPTPQEILQNCNIYNQYLDTNLHAFINGLCQLYDTHMNPYYNTLIQYTDLAKARGLALDYKGKMLNFNRYITFEDPLDVVQPGQEGIDEYRVIRGYEKECRLNDDSYRTVLQLLSKTKNTKASLNTLSRTISDILDAEVYIGDHMDMQYITYYFLDRIPGWLEVSMRNFDILPRPAGMSTKYISAISRLFGFLFQFPYIDIPATAKLVSAFWKARFPEVFSPHHYNTALQWFSSQDYIMKNKTEADLQAHYIKHYHFMALQEAKQDRRAFLNMKIQEDAQKDRRYMYNYMYNNPDSEHYDPTKPLIRTVAQEMQDDYDPNDSPGTQAAKAFNRQISNLKRFLKRFEVLDEHKKWLLWEQKKDLRESLWWDRQSGWYFYKEPRQGSSPDPFYQAALYRDDCGMWEPQEPLHDAILMGAGKHTLRHARYPEVKLFKQVSSPFLDRYGDGLREVLRNNDIRSINKTKEMFQAMHDAVRLWHSAKPIDKYTFRGILEFEYKLVGIYEKADEILDEHSNYYTSRQADTPEFIKALDDDYKELSAYYKKYVGRVSYYDSDRWRDDRNAIAYKEFKHWAWLRAQLKYIQNKINRLYYTAYNAQRDYSLPFNSSYTYDMVYSLQYDLKRPTQGSSGYENKWYTAQERSKYYGSNSDYYSAVKMSWKRLNDDYYYYKRLAQEAEDKRWRHEYAAEMCDDLDKMKNTRGQHTKMMWCLSERNLNKNPPDSCATDAVKDRNNHDCGNYWSSQDKTNNVRDTIRSYSSNHYTWKSQFAAERDKYNAAVAMMEKEMQIRILRSSRYSRNTTTLGEIIDAYESWGYSNLSSDYFSEFSDMDVHPIDLSHFPPPRDWFPIV